MSTYVHLGFRPRRLFILTDLTRNRFKVFFENPLMVKIKKTIKTKLMGYKRSLFNPDTQTKPDDCETCVLKPGLRSDQNAHVEMWPRRRAVIVQRMRSAHQAFLGDDGSGE